MTDAGRVKSLCSASRSQSVWYRAGKSFSGTVGGREGSGGGVAGPGSTAKRGMPAQSPARRRRDSTRTGAWRRVHGEGYWRIANSRVWSYPDYRQDAPSSLHLFEGRLDLFELPAERLDRALKADLLLFE